MAAKAKATRNKVTRRKTATKTRVRKPVRSGPVKAPAPVKTGDAQKLLQRIEEFWLDFGEVMEAVKTDLHRLSPREPLPGEVDRRIRKLMKLLIEGSRRPFPFGRQFTPAPGKATGGARRRR